MPRYLRTYECERPNKQTKICNIYSPESLRTYERTNIKNERKNIRFLDKIGKIAKVRTYVRTNMINIYRNKHTKNPIHREPKT